MKILLDAMGGDNAPDANIKGAVKAINQIKAEVILIGKKEVIESRTKEIYGKTGGRTYKHFVQSFAPGEDITPEKAHEI